MTAPQACVIFTSLEITAVQRETMSARRKRSGGRRAALIILAVALLGCHPRPAGEVAEARAALAAAWAACAPEYAGARFDAATTLVDSLALERAQGGQRSCGGCERAIILSREAERLARERLAGARAGVEAAILEAEEALAKARTAGEGGPPSAAVTAAAARLDEARRLASASHCNYLRAMELATEAKSLAKHADSRALASLRR